MEKVTMKIELDRDDFSTMLHLSGSKLTDEIWAKIKGRECLICDEDLKDQAVQMKLAFSSLVFCKLLKDK